MTHADADLFSTPNGFDNLQVDVAALFRDHPAERVHAEPKLWEATTRLYSSRLVPQRLRELFWHGLRRTRLEQGYYTRFRTYWARVLGGRPLWGVDDLHFLRGIYRMRFQRMGATPTNSGHLAAWQKPEVIHHLLHSVYKESQQNALGPVAALDMVSGKARRVLEFGCGAAPIATSLFEFRKAARDFEFWLSDIETASFHYAGWKFGAYANVNRSSLRPEADFRLEVEGPFDAIYCMAVLEHVNDPVETVRNFHRLIRPGGVLIFDYVLSDAQGLDSVEGLRDRGAALRFFEENFRVLSGRLDAERSMTMTVVTPKK